MNLEENFIEYKDITLNIIEIVKTEEYEKLDEIFQKRQLILDDISVLNCSKEELNKFYMQYELKSLDAKLAIEIKVREKELLKKIEQNKKKQAGLAGYNNISSKAVFLSKTI
ncbi:hypothetical protein LL037_19920 [Clostridium estertheticum]|uniref:hypothetical protein n=1 Tax=Clostridium estertheticum TaxID=238834 RepID=UPI001C0B6C14|nr:hypothetical protein [Clostridium estertheticum]MBU3198737.1 hypothetical protein [Clostridium estertheticum]WAG64710.1 hypothetical protein LL037_19920 [Clostridium estertheticum]